MNKAEILGLAARIEALEGPDREVDEAVQCAIHGATAEMQHHGRNAYHKNGQWISIGEVKPYTSSIDAATSLFPADCFYRSGHDGAGPDVTMFFCDAIASDAHGLPLRGVRAVALTEPCARTAAALRAIASTMEDDRG